MPEEIPANHRVVLTGDATIQSADAMHAQLLSVAGERVVTIDCSGITTADLSVVQLILAARLSAQRSGRSVVLAQPATGALLNTLQRGGFLATAGTKPDSNQAFWLQTADIQ